MRRGVLYSATGDQHFQEALRSARSSLRFNRMHHLIYTDRPAPPDGNGIAFGAIKNAGNPFADRIAALRASPFEQTLHLDTDTHIAADLGEVFDLLERFDVALAHAAGYLGEADPEVPPAFYELNAGVIAYRKSPAVWQWLETWRATYLDWIASEPFPNAGRGNGTDQPALRRTLWQSGLSMYVLGPEYNCRTIHPMRLVGPAKIIHGRPADYEATLTHLNTGAPDSRIFPELTER